MARTKTTEKLSVTLPVELVSELRQTVPSGEVSAFVADAVRDSLARRRFQEALDRGMGAWTDDNHPDLMTPEDSTAYVRALRDPSRWRVADRENDNDK